MAEGYLRKYCDGKAEVFSAGTESHGLNPNAVLVMNEDGIDISGHHSKTIELLPVKKFDFVITVCDNARENCPYYPAASEIIHHNFPDPAKAEGSKEEILNQFRIVRDQIKEYFSEFCRSYLNS